MDVPFLQLCIMVVAERAALIGTHARLKVHCELLALARDVAFQVLERSKVGEYVKIILSP